MINGFPSLNLLSPASQHHPIHLSPTKICLKLKIPFLLFKKKTWSKLNLFYNFEEKDFFNTRLFFYSCGRQFEEKTHSGAGSPSASHSITKGLSFWSCRTFTFTDKINGCHVLMLNIRFKKSSFSHLEEQLVCWRLFHHVWRALNCKQKWITLVCKGPVHGSKMPKIETGVPEVLQFFRQIPCNRGKKET